MQQGFALGVDLGTSNTVAVLRWSDGRTRALLADGVPVMPSGVYLDEHGRLHVGRDAARLAQIEPARFEPNPKRRIDEAGVLLGDREVATVDLLGAVLAAVARAAVEAVGFLPPAVLTYPAAWGQRRRDRLAAAATRAGWPPPLLVPEPVAAARYFADVLRRPVPVGSSIAVFDFGAGTLDVAVVRNEGGRFAVLGSGGIENLGGLDVDAALVDHLAGVIGRTRPEVWAALSTPDTADRRRARKLFWDDVRGAKEMLSRTSVAPVAVPGPDGAVHLTREELERVATPLLRRAVQETAAVVQRCGLRPDQLAGLFLVGGSSRLPLAARLLHADLGVAPTVLEQPELPVAEGALAELPLATPAYAGPAYARAARAGAARATVTGTAVGTAAVPVSGPVTPGPMMPVSAAPFAAAHTSPAPAVPTSPPPIPFQPGATGPRASVRSKRLVLIGVAVATVLALVMVAAVVWFRRDRPVDFTDLESAGVSVPLGDKVDNAFSHTVGDRAYLAWQTDKALRIAAVDLDKRKKIWEVPAPAEAEDWVGILATPDAVLVFADNVKDSEPRPMYVLNPANGRERWRRDVFGKDKPIAFGAALVIDSANEGVTRAFDWGSGDQKWQLPHRAGSSGPLYTETLPVGGDEAGPATFAGEPFAARGSDGARLVQLDSGRTLRVVDVANGKARELAGVATNDDLVRAIGDKLYVLVRDNGFQLREFDLGKPGAPRVVYTQTDSSRRPVGAPGRCGDGQVCLLEQGGGDAKTTELVAVDSGDRRVAWRRAAPDTDRLVAVGDTVLATAGGSQPASALFDADGRQLLKAEDRKTLGVRLNPASLLMFSRVPQPYTETVAITGVTAGGDRTSLGSLENVRVASCSWNTAYLTCAVEKEFRVWRFAD